MQPRTPAIHHESRPSPHGRPLLAIALALLALEVWALPFGSADASTPPRAAAGSPRLAAAHPTFHAIASWYGPGLLGNPLGCPHDGQLHSWTIGVASKTLRCGTRLQFLTTRGRWLAVTVIDRGPYVAGRSFDLTEATHARLGLTCGVCSVTYRRAA